MRKKEVTALTNSRPATSLSLTLGRDPIHLMTPYLGRPLAIGTSTIEPTLRPCGLSPEVWTSRSEKLESQNSNKAHIVCKKAWSIDFWVTWEMTAIADPLKVFIHYGASVSNNIVSFKLTREKWKIIIKILLFGVVCDNMLNNKTVNLFRPAAWRAEIAVKLEVHVLS